ncbi:MAG: hypothetical protein EA388_03530 [Nitriliruptor sp.]|nr:MAG: hypothetical protein EA388_03530 [Nitriliruptor sp.]
MAHDVRQCLRDREVGDRLDTWRRPLQDLDVQGDRNRGTRVSDDGAGSRPRSVRIDPGSMASVA